MKIYIQYLNLVRIMAFLTHSCAHEGICADFLMSTEIKFSLNYAMTLTRRNKKDTESLKIDELYEFSNDSSRD